MLSGLSICWMLLYHQKDAQSTDRISTQLAERMRHRLLWNRENFSTDVCNMYDFFFFCSLHCNMERIIYGKWNMFSDNCIYFLGINAQIFAFI